MSAIISSAVISGVIASAINPNLGAGIDPILDPNNPDLFSFWGMESAVSPVTDKSPNGRDLPIFGTLSTVSGVVGNALRVPANNVNNYMSIMDIPSEVNGFISLWLKIPAVPTLRSRVLYAVHDAAITSARDFFEYRIETNGKFRTGWSDLDGTTNQVEGDTALTLNAINHVVVASTDTEWKIWINKVLSTLTVTSGVNNGQWIGNSSTLQPADKITLGRLEDGVPGSNAPSEQTDFDEPRIFDGINPTQDDVDALASEGGL